VGKHEDLADLYIYDYVSQTVDLPEVIYQMVMFNLTGKVNLSIRGFLSHGGTPIAGWLLFHGKSENNMDDLGGTPISGNFQMGI